MKGVRKVFRGAVKLVKKVIKPVLIAGAVYLTGGLALSAFPATAGFAASLPGFGISSAGAATGIFSKAASAIGLSGGLQAGAAANAGTTIAAAGTAAAGGAAAAGAAGATAAKVGMGLTEKLLLAQMGTKAIGAFLAPSTDDIMEAKTKWRGAYYGANADGSGEPAEAPQQATPMGQTQPRRARSLMDEERREIPQMTPPQPSQVAQAPSQPQGRRQRDLMEPVSNDPIEQTRTNAPGVRYL